MLAINTNIGSLNAQRSLYSVQEAQQTAMERLTSGSRINRAKDDAAGLAISSNMQSISRSNEVLIRGMNDGVSFIQTAEGALHETMNMLQRMRELTLQSLSGTNNDTQRGYLNKEFYQLSEEIDDIASGTKVFGEYPLAGLSTATFIGDLFPASGSSISESSGISTLAFIPSGSTGINLYVDGLSVDDDIHIFTKGGMHLVGPAIGDNTLASKGITDTVSMESTLLTTANGFDDSAAYDASNLNDGGGYNAGATNATSYNGMTIGYTGDDDTDNDGTINEAGRERFTVDTVTEDLLVFVVGNGSYSATLNYTNLPDPNNPISASILTSSYDESYKMDIMATPADTTALGLNGLSIDTLSNASSSVLSALDGAIETVSGYFASYGALVSNFESRISNVLTENVNLANSISRIKDADFAAESAELARTNVLQQAGMAMLSQANQYPQQVLSLLK